MTLAAITIKQPWARAIAAGIKTVENRSRPTSHRGSVAIHAGKAISKEGCSDPRILEAFADGPWNDPALRQPLGAVIAVADLVDCHPADTCDRDTCKPWGDPAGYHLVLACAVQIDQPVPARGSLGLPWRLPEDVDLAVRAQLPDALRG